LSAALPNVLFNLQFTIFDIIIDRLLFTAIIIVVAKQYSGAKLFYVKVSNGIINKVRNSLAI
jgi:Na+/H+ antiporter NhaB